MVHDDSNIPQRNNTQLNIQNQRVGQGAANAKRGGANQGQSKNNANQLKLPKTGIEQPYMKDRPRHKEHTKEFEQIAQVNSVLIEEYQRIDEEKANNPSGYQNKIVFDCLDNSPHYDSSNEPYIDENDSIELPQDDQPVDSRKQYPYGPSSVSTN